MHYALHILYHSLNGFHLSERRIESELFGVLINNVRVPTKLGQYYMLSS